MLTPPCLAHMARIYGVAETKKCQFRGSVWLAPKSHLAFFSFMTVKCRCGLGANRNSGKMIEFLWCKKTKMANIAV
jgi:hypothetical protein